MRRRRHDLELLQTSGVALAERGAGPLVEPELKRLNKRWQDLSAQLARHKTVAAVSISDAASDSGGSRGPAAGGAASAGGGGGAAAAAAVVGTQHAGLQPAAAAGPAAQGSRAFQRAATRTALFILFLRGVGTCLLWGR